MSHFLWIEDFETSPRIAAHQVFGGILSDNIFSDHRQELRRTLKEHGIFIELSFQDGWRFIREDLAKIDYVILDIDLPAYLDDAPSDDVKRILEYYYGCADVEDRTLLKAARDKLKEKAGFHLYSELVVELGFPKDHILFVSNHADRIQTINETFKAARISEPKSHTKSKDDHDHNTDVRSWIEKNYRAPYSRLRRGIIEGCKYLRERCSDKCRFDKFLSNKGNANDASPWEPSEYLETLENFLPLKEPNSQCKSTLYKLFVRLLAHEWDVAFPCKVDNLQETFAFSWIMKMARNWSAHGRVFESATEKDVAFLFIVNMRAMFDLGNDILSYESHLLSLFDNAIPETFLKEKMGTKRDGGRNLRYDGRTIPFEQSYADLLNKYREWQNKKNIHEVTGFHDLLNELQRSRCEDYRCMMDGLFKVFWFLTSSGFVNASNGPGIRYYFGYFDYMERNYIAEIARHIYTSSFPEA